MLKRNYYQPKDFLWTTWNEAEMQRVADEFLAFKKSEYEKIKQISKEERTFENTIFAIEKTNHAFENILKISFLMNVSPLLEIRAKAQEIVERVEKELITIEFDEGMYRAVKDFAEKNESLEADEAKVLKNLLRDYKRMGFELPAPVREKLQENLKELSRLTTLYSNNINEYKDHILVTESELDGLPVSFKESLKKEGDKYQVSLEYPEFFPFMENALNAEKRKELADKNLQKGGEENVALLHHILMLRDENAKMLGFENHAQFQLEVKMAKNEKNVFSFLEDLTSKIESGLKSEMQLLKEFKSTLVPGNEEVFYYDIAFLINNQRKQLFAVDGEKIREYFPASHVLAQMFEIYGKLFSLEFKKVSDRSVWHEEVDVYELHEKENGNLLAYFFLDLYPREGKYGHAAVFNITSPHVVTYKGEECRTPVASLVCNFPRPHGERPSLLNHNEVDTLFHEFGHVLHEVLSDVRFSTQSGFSVARDFVEAPSQMLENWVWNKEVLTQISKHFETGESLPSQIIENMIRAKKHMISYSTMRQLIFGIFDMTLHTKDIQQPIDEFYNSLMQKYMGVALPANSHFSAGFGHLMGYDAGYYGYLWSKVYAADMFTRFENEGVLSEKVGSDYRKWILEKGSTLDEKELVEGFLGRESNSEAFLRELVA